MISRTSNPLAKVTTRPPSSARAPVSTPANALCGFSKSARSAHALSAAHASSFSTVTEAMFSSQDNVSRIMARRWGQDLGKTVGCRMSEQSVEPDKTRSLPIAEGQGWRAAEVVCAAGPADRPFEEQHAWTSVAAVLDGVFTYRSHLGRALMTRGSLLLGEAGRGFW